MESFSRQQFDLMLHEAAGNFTERIVHRCGGPEIALARLQRDPDGEGVWISEFVGVVFEDNILNSAAGACFVLDALHQRTVPADPGGVVDTVVSRLARAAFGEVLAKQAAQLIQQQMVFSPRNELL